MHIHLDPLGGIAGDMFIAAMSDTFPELKNLIIETLAVAGLPEVTAKFSARHDQFLTGTGFKVTLPEMQEHSHSHAHGHAQEHHHSHDDHHHHDHNHGHHSHSHDAVSHFDDSYDADHSHGHRSYAEIKQTIQSANLNDSVKKHALEIFRLIGEAESSVHGIALDTILFHEVGGWDSVVDVIGAAIVIDWLSGSTWSYSSVPVGGGYINSSHGLLPVPMPATALLLRGFAFRDDGIMGERVTPTGAAILKYLAPSHSLPPNVVQLVSVGYGFGTKVFKTMSNVLRVTAYDSVRNKSMNREQIGLINFEIDDMTAEEIAVAIHSLRSAVGVLDVTQAGVFGKKQRLATSVQVLTEAVKVNEVASLILNSTTTLGVRVQVIDRFFVSRTMNQTKQGDREVGVKIAVRPNGRATAKVDIDDIAPAADTCFELREARIEVESVALQSSSADLAGGEK